MANQVKLARDASLTVTKALPSAAGATTTADPITVTGRAAPIEVAVYVPALSTTIAPDTKTVTVVIECATDAAFTAPVTVATQVLTGAGGAGVSASTTRGAVHQDYGYARAKVTLGTLTTDASALSFTVNALA